MNYKDAIALAQADGSFLEGFVKCTYVQLFNKSGKQLFTIRYGYASLPGVAFRLNTKGKFVRSNIVPICRAYDFKESGRRVPVVPSEELKYAIKQLILNSEKTKDTWKLYRRWIKDYPPSHKQGDIELIAERRSEPEFIAAGSHGNVKETAYYIEYWIAPEYDVVLGEKYIELLNILESGEQLYVKDVAVDWYTDVAVVTTISDNILTDENSNLITDENGEPVKLYDENGNEIPTDANGKPIFPEGYEIKIGTEELEAAKKKLDRAKAILAAAGAISFL